jgi:hypothetical protein
VLGQARSTRRRELRVLGEVSEIRAEQGVVELRVWQVAAPKRSVPGIASASDVDAPSTLWICAISLLDPPTSRLGVTTGALPHRVVAIGELFSMPLLGALHHGYSRAA